MILVESVANAITAAVATYFVFSRLNPVRNIARNVPPVPTIPVIKPEILPPVIVVLVFAANFSEGLSKNKTENTIKNIPRVICRMVCGITQQQKHQESLRVYWVCQMQLSFSYLIHV